MLNTLAVANYRSINKLVIPLGRLNLITGPNGSGKSNLYRALRLLAETAHGGVVNALAREGGLDSTFWAGPETLSRRMRTGEVAIEHYPQAPEIEEAMVILMQAYNALGLTDLRDSTQRVLLTNFPKSPYLQPGGVKKSVPWWRLWDPDW